MPGRKLIVSAAHLLTDAAAPGAGSSFQSYEENRTFQLTGLTTAGAGACVVDVEVSNDGTNFIQLAQITLTLGTTLVSDGFASVAPWVYVRGNVISISGTGAKVNLWMGA